MGAVVRRAGWAGRVPFVSGSRGRTASARRRFAPVLLFAFAGLLRAESGLAAGEATIRLAVADWVAPLDHYGWWGVVPTGQQPAKAQQRSNSPAEALVVAAGSYDLYWAQDYDTRDAPLLLARGVKVAKGEAMEVRADSGVKLEVAPWVPARDSTYGWWGASPAGAGAKARVQWSKAAEAILLAPGSYDIYWVQDYDTRDTPLLLARAVEVAAGELVTVQADTGIKLETASWVPPRDSTYGWWGASPAGAGAKARVQWSKAAEAILLAPGRYDVFWVQDYDTRDAPLLLAGAVEVEKGEVATVQAGTGIRLEVAPWVPPRDSTYGWWGASPAGAGAKARVQWSKAAEAILLPPGGYDVYWVQDYDTRDAPLLLAGAVEVAEGEVATVQAGTGIRLEVAPWVPPRDATYGWWGAAPAGSGPEARVQWSKTAEAILLAPGRYDVYWVQDYQTRDAPLRLKADVAVAAGELATVKADSGLAVQTAADAAPLDSTYGWWGVSQTGAGPDARLQWSQGRSDLPLLVPPGTYDVYWKQDYDGAPERKAEGVEIAPGQLVQLDLSKPEAAPQVVAQPGAPEPAAQPPAAATPPAAPGAQPAQASIITTFGVTSDGAMGIGADFPQGVRRVDATYNWKGAPSDYRIDLRWSKDGQVVLEQDETLTEPSGSSRWYLKMQADEPLPAGSYQVELLENGQLLFPPLPFTIGRAAAQQDDLAKALRSAEAQPPAQPDTLAADDFEDPKSGWSETHADGVDAGYSEGRYRIAMTKPIPWVFGAQIADYGEAIFEVDAAPEEGSAGHPYGLFARAQDVNNFHGFVVAADNSYAAFRVTDGTFSLDSPPNAELPEGAMNPAGQSNRLRLVADGAALGFYVNDHRVATVPQAGWPSGRAGVLAANPTEQPAAVSFDNWRVLRIARAGAAGPPAAAAIDFAQYAPQDSGSAIKEVGLGYSDADEPSLARSRSGTSFMQGITQVVVWYRFAGAPRGRDILARWFLGEELLYETEPAVLEEPAGTGWWGLVNGDYRPLPAGHYRVELVEDGAVATTIPFQIDPRNAEATPWASRGWARGPNGDYVNAEHGLKLAVPHGWQVSDELRFPVRFLWFMGKLAPNGQSRLDVNIARRKDHDWKNAREFFDTELQGMQQATYKAGNETRPLFKRITAGPSHQPDVFETLHELQHDGSRSHQFYFLREGIGYVVTFKAAADATPAELAELEAVRRSMGL